VPRGMRRIRRCVVMASMWIFGALLLSVLACTSATGQDRPVFSSEADLVVLHVNVKDRQGAYVAGLKEDAFSILEDGRAQTIQLFTREDAPVTVGLLIDSSGSMQPNRARVIAAATAFAAASHPQDELFALAFNETVTAALPSAQPFTGDVRVLRDALTRAIDARGRTGLFDALSAGLDYLARGRQERKVLVVVSDGGDNASRATFEEILTKTQASNAVIYTVAIVDPVERDTNPKLLRRIAQASGGEAFEPKGVGDITEVLRHIAADIRHTYTIGYVSTNTTRDGAFRRLRVTVAAPASRQRLGVRTRGGYLAGRQQGQSNDVPR
jgi:Ca-activated chloride channel homolog